MIKIDFGPDEENVTAAVLLVQQGSVSAQLGQKIRRKT